MARTISTAERRTRLGNRHHLARRATRVDLVAGGIAGLHSSDPATPYLAARARVSGLAVADLERALYDDRSLIRILGMRRTLFVVPSVLGGVIDSACTRALGPPERTRLAGMLEAQGVARDGRRWIERVTRATLTALDARGEATAGELATDVADLRVKLRFGEGRAWQADVGVSTRLLFLLATEGQILRARPLGTWLSSQYRWTRVEHWLGTPFPDHDPAAARKDLARAWLGAFGPGTLTDLKWWTGWTVAHTKAALSAVDAVEVATDTGPAFVLSDDLDRPRATRPWVAFLPSLDPTVMGWKERDWYLGPHAPLLFDRNGNAGPTVWCDGRVIGGWAQRPDATIAFRLLEDPGAEARESIDDAAGALESWLHGIRVRPRFPTGLEHDLAG
jgi:hypothetical protein